MTEQQEYRPIKIVEPHKDDLRPPRSGGGTKKDFTDYYDKSRDILINGIADILEYYDDTFSRYNLPAVARVTLRDDAWAKSHRPAKLFSPRTCPIIGNQSFGELLISVQPNSLEKLMRQVDHGCTFEARNDISKILSINPYREKDALGGWTIEMIAKFLENVPSKRVKLRLFDHRTPELSQQLVDFLPRLSETAGIGVPVRANYGSKLSIFRLDIPSDIEQLHLFSSFVGTQSLEPFEQFYVSTQTIPVKPVTNDLFPKPVPDEEYPIVGMIDSGTDPDNEHLQAWVSVRDESLVPRDDQNNHHGSLVAGTLINGKRFNNDHPGFPDCNVKVVDVVALPASGRLDELDLIDAVSYACSNYPDIRVWNLSINSISNLCRDDCFSSFAIAIDEIQDKFKSMIINSAGNYVADPMPKWRRPDQGGCDRLTSPADSLRALTVGSLAHLGHPNACAQIDEPSPFTRRGPGAGFVPKPEITHYGGNTFADKTYRQLGIISTDADCNLAETVGTSFAAPLASATAAQLWESLEGEPSRHLVKAMMIHFAVLNSDDVTSDDLPYRGFGKPPTVEAMLSCQPSEATLIFDLDLPFSHRSFNKPDFPIPPCLHRDDGRMFGEVIMTLAYDPPVDPYDGAAYSQVNINPSIGICRTNGADYDRKLIPYPKDIGDLFEKNQIQHGFKWSPVKVYRARFPRGINTLDMWRISMEMMTRKPELVLTSQPVTLIVTIRDPDGDLPVYDEVVAMMNRSGWSTLDLPIKAYTRVRSGISLR